MKSRSTRPSGDRWAVGPGSKEDERGATLAEHAKRFQFGLGGLLLFASGLAVFLAMNRVVVLLVGSETLIRIYIWLVISLIFLGIQTALAVCVYSVTIGCTFLIDDVADRLSSCGQRKGGAAANEPQDLPARNPPGADG